MNVRKLSVNKACIFLAVLLLAAMVTVSVALYALTQDITAGYNRCLVCTIVRHLCAVLLYLFYGAGSPQIGDVLRCFLQFDG